MARILKRSWHEVFFECISPHTDAPDTYVVWSALSLIGAALKNHVYIEIGTYTLYPNQFIVLTGPPGVGKGTVMNIVESLAKETKPAPVNTLNDRITAEKILERISDGWVPTGVFFNASGQLLPQKPDHNCLLFSQELRVLLGASEWMLEFLEEAWSRSSYDYQTKNKGSVFIDSMCCSLLAASVPEFLRNVNREAHMVITGGFSSRCLFIYADSPSKNLPFPEPLKQNPKSKALYDNLVMDLQAIAQLKGEFIIDIDAKMLFRDFLLKFGTSKIDDNEAVANFRARVKAHTLKLAMVLSASRSDSLHINKIDMLNAISEIEKVFKALEKLFRSAGENPEGSHVSRVLEIIERLGRCSRKELIKLTIRHMTVDALDRVLYAAIEMGFIERDVQNRQDFFKHIPAKARRNP